MLDLDIIAGKYSSPTTVTGLYAQEQGSGRVWRPAVGKTVEVKFSVLPNEAGRTRFQWNWFEIAGDYPKVSLDGQELPARFGGLYEVTPGGHTLRFDFLATRHPIPGGDPRPIAAAITSLRITSDPLPQTSTGEKVLAGGLCTVILAAAWWLLFRLRGV